MSTRAAPFSGPQAEPLSQIGRVVNTFIAPSKTFTDIRRSASWWLPWLIISIVGVAFAYTVDRKIGYDRVVENTFRMVPKQAARFEQMPPEQRAQAMKIQVLSRKIMSYGAPVTGLFWMIVIAAVLMGTMNFGAGAEIKFGAALAVVVYGSLPAIFKDLLAMVSISMSSFNPEGFILQNPAATNPGYFISDPGKSLLLYSFASAFDVFTIWCLILMGIGFAFVSKLKRGTTLGIVFGWWVLLMLIGIGITAAFA